MKKIIVAIDGYSSCGKSTIAKALAKHAGYTYVDTGAMYRAIGLYTLRKGLTEEAAIIAALPEITVGFTVVGGAQHVNLNGEDVEPFIRTLEVGNCASRVSAIKEVRAFLVAQQQAMGIEKGIVMDGRDIGTVVFPNAELKVFVTASARVRAERRLLELQAKGDTSLSLEEVQCNIEERDYIDSHREVTPLVQAPDAKLLDNSNMTIPEQNALVLQWAKEAMGE